MIRDRSVRSPLARLAAAGLALAVAGCGMLRSRDVDLATRVEGRAGAIAVYDRGELVTEYRYAGSRVPSLYPLFAPGGVPVTRAYPFEEREGEEHDHPHHASLWLAHGDVNGIDFWHDPEARIENGEAVLCAAGTGEARIRARNFWLAKGELVLIEDRLMTFRLDDDRRVIDFRIKLSPAFDSVTFGDTKEGTFALRLHPELQLVGPVAKGSARNSEGVKGADVWGERARWIAYFGPVEGRDVTVAVMDHPRNLRHPTWWHARDYGLCAANPFGVSAFEDEQPAAGALQLGAGETLELRYRVVLREGLLDKRALERDWEDFAH